MAKLTLSVDDAVIARAKRFAERRGTSVSDLVERYLDLVTKAAPEVEPTPVLRRLRGILAGTDERDYRRHVERKYR